MRRTFALLTLAASALSALAQSPASKPTDFDPIRASNPKPNRHITFTELAAKGPHLRVVAATCFGTAGHEEFLDAGQLADGTLVAFGNAWGPEFPGTPAVLGKGKHQGLKPVQAGRGKDAEAPRREDPDVAGFIACYSPDMKQLTQTIRFDWGVASLITAAVTPDGKAVILLGRATPAFRTFAGDVLHVEPSATPAPYTYEGTRCSGDIFVARLSVEANPKLAWAWVLDARGSAYDRLWFDHAGSVYFDAKGLQKIAADGKTLTKVSPHSFTGTSRWLWVDPADGSAFFGGDRNTRTGREPYRQPYLYKFDPAGNKVATLYEPAPREISSAKYGLESDSSVRTMTRAKDGSLLVTGWSDGGNSVFPRQAKDFKHYAPEGGFGMTPWWPKGAGSFAHIMRLDAATFDTLSHQWWCGYLPMDFESERHRNAPGGTNITYTTCLADGSFAFAGSAASGYIQTPNAFWKDPHDGQRHGGATVTVLSPDLKAFRFSSYLPGCASPRLAATRDGLLVVSRATSEDAPSVHALQKYAGASDGHLILLESPKP